MSKENKKSKAFKQRLSASIKENNLTQQELAKAIGTTRQAISWYVRGDNLPSVDVLMKMADYFNVSMDYLMGRDTDKEEPILEDKDVLQKAIDTYGEEAQQDMAIEEALELALAILKHRRAKREKHTEDYIIRRKNNIIEESADVKVMIKQLEMMFDCKDEVEEQVKFKVYRLKKRLEE